MAINLDNAQYGKFVQFAEQQIQAGNEKAIARDGGAGAGPLAGHTIVVADGGDKVASFWRSQADKDANNAARDLFRQTIADMFGSEANIPRSVREAMNLDDFGQGKPLTARRIIAVKAEVDRIVSVHTAYNDGLVGNILNGRFNQLPQDLQDGLAQLVNNLRVVFGPNAVPPNAVISHVLHSETVRSDFDALRKAANAQGRDLTSAEILGLYTVKASNRLAVTTAGAFILAKAKAREPGIRFTALSIGMQFEARHPGLLAEILLCKNPDDIAIVLQNHEAEIDAFVDVTVRSNAACKVVETKAQAKLAAALGLDARLVASHVTTDKLRLEAKELTSAIMLGTAPGSRDPGYNAEAAYDALVDKFVQQRTEVYAAIDSLDLPEDVKNRWKADCVGGRVMPLLTPAQLFEVVQSVDVRKLQGAFSKGMPTKLAVEMLNNVTKTIIAAIDRVTGTPHFLANADMDDMTLLYGLLITAVKAKSPAFAQALKDAGNAFFDAAGVHCEANAALADATIFVKTLSFRGGTENEVPLTSKEGFLAIVEADAEAALAECGVTDAKVRKDVKDALLRRGSDVFAGATGLKGLSDFLAASKANAKTLAQVLNGIAKSRSGALNVAATVISVSSKISKAYVMNNLGTSAITSDSGKLRFLYDEVLAKARNGEWGDILGYLNKANDIIAKFAQGKADILKAIDEAGFDPAARAAHRLAALRDPGWTDPDVANVAKGLAGDKTLKNAARLFAQALTGDAAQALDDHQMRNVFITFGKAFVLTLKTLFKEQAERWSGSIETQQRLMKMVFQLLEKEQPGIAEALARLVASGRFNTVRDLLSEGLNDIHARKMDFMVLSQYNLMGPPAGERIRAVMANPDLQYDEAEFQKCQAEDELYNVTNVLMSAFGADFPTSGMFNADKYIASITTGRAMIAKYADGLTQETVPLLAKLVGVLDWRSKKAAASEEIVKNYVEDMKTWRDVTPGSTDASGLEKVFQRRTNDYLKDVLAGNAHASFNTTNHPGLLQTFLDDLPRCTYIINGKKVLGTTLQAKIAPYMESIKDPVKRKVVSVMINQQLFGDFTASVSSRIPFAGWKAGMPDEPVDPIPEVGKFASRDVMKTGLPLLDTGPMEYAIDVSPDESAVTVHAKSVFPVHADVTLPTTMIGTCTISQEFVIDLSGEDPEIRDFKIGQALE